jgi:hypothetical protein
MERAFGRLFVQHNSKWLRAYKVERVEDGRPMTYGWLMRRVARNCRSLPARPAPFPLPHIGHHPYQVLLQSGIADLIQHQLARCLNLPLR